jgi:hypothetical protein
MWTTRLAIFMIVYSWPSREIAALDRGHLLMPTFTLAKTL